MFSLVTKPVHSSAQERYVEYNPCRGKKKVSPEALVLREQVCGSAFLEDRYSPSSRSVLPEPLWWVNPQRSLPKADFKQCPNIIRQASCSSSHSAHQVALCSGLAVVYGSGTFDNAQGVRCKYVFLSSKLQISLLALIAET